MFEDSWKRLLWVEKLVADASEIVDDVARQVLNARVILDRRVVGNFVHVRVRLHEPFVFDSALAFLIADLVINARSCLDMAVTQAVEKASCPVRNPQFPILDDIDEWGKNGTCQSIEKALDPALVDAIKILQPKHDTDFGFLMVPFNMVALVIREVANANKHRNLTPAVHSVIGRGLKREVNDLKLVYADESAWEATCLDLVEVKFPDGRVMDDSAVADSVFANFELQITASRFHYGGLEKIDVIHHGFDIAIPVRGILYDVPRFVRHALESLEYAASNGAKGIEPSPYVEWWDALP